MVFILSFVQNSMANAIAIGSDLVKSYIVKTTRNCASPLIIRS